MEINSWFGCLKVRACPWIDGKRIYFNVQSFTPGQSIEQPPALDKTVYVTDDEAGRKLVYEFTDSLANHVAGMQIEPGREITLTAQRK